MCEALSGSSKIGNFKLTDSLQPKLPMRKR
jgi:hypothetical protein